MTVGGEKGAVDFLVALFIRHIKSGHFDRHLKRIGRAARDRHYAVNGYPKPKKQPTNPPLPPQSTHGWYARQHFHALEIFNDTGHRVYYLNLPRLRFTLGLVREGRTESQVLNALYRRFGTEGHAANLLYDAAKTCIREGIPI